MMRLNRNEVFLKLWNKYVLMRKKDDFRGKWQTQYCMLGAFQKEFCVLPPEILKTLLARADRRHCLAINPPGEGRF